MYQNGSLAGGAVAFVGEEFEHAGVSALGDDFAHAIRGRVSHGGDAANRKGVGGIDLERDPVTIEGELVLERQAVKLLAGVVEGGQNFFNSSIRALRPRLR